MGKRWVLPLIFAVFGFLVTVKPFIGVKVELKLIHRLTPKDVVRLEMCKRSHESRLKVRLYFTLPDPW
jgi:hypothetical protein